MDMQKVISRKLQLIIFLTGLVLGLRFLFVLVGIDGGGGFDGWVFDTSATMLYPLRAVFEVAEPSSGAGTIDFAALFGGAIYAMLGLFSLSLVDRWSSKKK